MPGRHGAPDHANVVIVGGGHNALVAASYLAGAGRSVVVLERRPVLGGAAVSTEAFPGTGVKLSRYSYLVSLLPQRIIDDLGLELSLRSRRYSSFTPHCAHGLLVDGQDAEATRNSFTIIGAGADAAGHRAFGERTARLAERLWPTFTEPLLRRSEAQAVVADAELWSDFIERPLGEVIERTAAHDVVRGLMLTDALIGTFSTAHADGSYCSRSRRRRTLHRAGRHARAHHGRIRAGQHRPDGTCPADGPTGSHCASPSGPDEPPGGRAPRTRRLPGQGQHDPPPAATDA